MRNILLLCDHAKSHLSQRAFDEVISINQKAPKQNLRLEILNVTHWLLRSLNPIANDLLDIAAYVYYADTSSKRGAESDVFDEDWTRRFTFVIPVRKPELWAQEAIAGRLVELLEYLTEDRYEFHFTERENTPEQLAIESISQQLPPSPHADCVSLFSGGMDSLAGAVHLHAIGRKPVLVSHQPRPVLVHLQRQIATPLRDRFPAWRFPHLGVWVNRKGKRATEESQRSRSFLFATLGALVAHELNLNELVICENGITSYNLPRLGQITGARATRATHPRFISLFRQLASDVFGSNFRIETPFMWKTRSEVIEVLKQNGCADLLPLSVSCAHSNRTRIHPHCGTCSQCVDRRFAVMQSGIDSNDELNSYEKDIFSQSLNDGREKMQAFSTVQFALDIRRRNLDSFCQEYVQAYDAIMDTEPAEGERFLKAIYDLHVRFAVTA